MKFVINTNYNAAGTVVLEGLIKRLPEVTRNVWDNYGAFDVALFMAPDSDIRGAKKCNPKIIAGIFDPKVSRKFQRDEVRAADFLIVSSIEQRDFFLKYNKNVFIYYMFPEIAPYAKTHSLKEKIVISYHGNKQHLDGMRDLSWALDELAKSHNIEFQAIYNIEKLGKWIKNHPKVCKVTHIQWTPMTLIESLKNADIGVAPSILPAPKLFARPFASFFSNPESYVKNDYVLRFKMSNNPGRLYVFAQMGVPVVADFTPSSAQIIRDGYSGFLVGTKEGWKMTLKILSESVEDRVKFSDNLRRAMEEEYPLEKNFKNFFSFLESIKSSMF